MSDNGGGGAMMAMSMSMFSFCIMSSVIAAVMVLFLNSSSRLTKPPGGGKPAQSEYIGGPTGGSEYRGDCPPGAWLGSVTMYSKYGKEINGFYAECVDVNGQVTPLLSSSKNGIVGGTNANAGWKSAFKNLIDPKSYMDALSGYTSGSGDVTKVGMGLAGITMNAYAKKDFQQSGLVAPEGINRVSAWTRPVGKTKEIAALAFTSLADKSVTFGGTTDSKNPRDQVDFACPEGTVITGIQGRAGERVNGIQFKCTSP